MVQSSLLNINPEPIGLYKLPPEQHEKYKSTLTSLWDNADSIYRQQRQEYTRYICNAPGQNLFEQFAQLSELEHTIRLILMNYISRIGYQCEDLLIHSSWLNRASEGAILDDHAHSNSFISANYFVNFNSKLHSPLSFRNDRCTMHRNAGFPYITLEELAEKSIYNIPRIGMNAPEGSILVWRSHMVHGYNTPNQGPGRMTLSLNALPKIVSNGAYAFSASSLQL